MHLRYLKKSLHNKSPKGKAQLINQFGYSPQIAMIILIIHDKINKIED